MDKSTTIDQITSLATTYGIKILGAIVIFIIGKWLAGKITGWAKKFMEKSNLDPMLIGFFGNAAYIILMIVVILAALNNLGVQTTSFVAILGAAGLAVGLALQGSLSNFASGVLIIFFRPFKIGDFIDAGGAAGIVQEISIFTTILKTPDNKKVIIPNSSVTGGNITNVSAHETRRVDMVFGVSYSDDLKQVRQIIQEVLDSNDKILKDPAPTVAVSELADSSVNFVVRPWVNKADYWDVYFFLNETIKVRFDEVGISIPFPQSDVHMFEQKAAS